LDIFIFSVIKSLSCNKTLKMLGLKVVVNYKDIVAQNIHTKCAKIVDAKNN